MRIELITSRDNRRLVEARKVRDGNVEGKIFVEGRRLAAEALRSDLTIEAVYFADSFADDDLRSAFHGPTFELPAKVFASIADTDSPQGIALVANRPETGARSFDPDAAVPLVVLLNEINNPANLGAVIRTAEAAGIRGVISSENSADVFSPKALRSSMGSAFRMPVWENASFDEAIGWAREKGIMTVAADVSANIAYTEIDWQTPHLLIFGSEAHGLEPEHLSAVDKSIKIPMTSSVESLNLAVSAGIILFEARRQAV